MEPSRDRFEMREVSVYDDLYDISQTKWSGIQEIVKVTRTTYLSKRDIPSVDISFYISSKKMSAKEYNHGIRAHWAIENSLHYIKDVTFGEDASPIRTGNAPTNFSIVRNITINIFRRCDFISMRQAICMLGGDIKELGKLLA
jgi:predicted transposase YbfD/YdcC